VKAVMDGEMYNTEAATLVARRDNGRQTSDLRWCFEALYRRKTDGAFFLHREGAALSRYSEIRAAVSVGSATIVPFSADQALRWRRLSRQANLQESKVRLPSAPLSRSST